LSFQSQHETLCIWVLLDPDNEKEEVKFRIFGTGHPVGIGKDWGYCGTAQLGAFVWHLFAKT